MNRWLRVLRGWSTIQTSFNHKIVFQKYMHIPRIMRCNFCLLFVQRSIYFTPWIYRLILSCSDCSFFKHSVSMLISFVLCFYSRCLYFHISYIHVWITIGRINARDIILVRRLLFQLILSLLLFLVLCLFFYLIF